MQNDKIDVKIFKRTDLMYNTFIMEHLIFFFKNKDKINLVKYINEWIFLSSTNKWKWEEPWGCEWSFQLVPVQTNIKT